MLIACLAATASAQLGQVLSQMKVSEESGGISTTFGPIAGFGIALATVGPFDDNAVPDLAVGVTSGEALSTTGTILLMELSSSLGVSHDTTLPVPAAVANGDGFGASLATMAPASTGNTGFRLAVGTPGSDLTALDAGAVWVVTYAYSDGDASIASAVQLAEETNGLVAGLAADDRFGASVAVIGDIDKDMVNDLAVGIPGMDGTTEAGSDSNIGGFAILLMNANGTVKSTIVHRQSSGAFDANVAGRERIGTSIVGIGDIDGNSVPDIAVGSPGDNLVATAAGAVRIYRLATDGSIVGQRVIRGNSSDFSSLGGSTPALNFFGTSLAADDLNGDGAIELMVGTNRGDQGSVWVLTLGTNGVVSSASEIANGVGGFVGDTEDFEEFGASVSVFPNAAGDGLKGLAIGHPFDDDGGDSGAIWLVEVGACGNFILDPGEQCEGLSCCTDKCMFETAGAECPLQPSESADAPCLDPLCDAAGNCGVPNTADCDDGIFCNGADTCADGTCSVHAGDPCAGGAECQDTCNENGATCNVAADVACTSDGNPCTVNTCDGAGTCTAAPNIFAPCDDGNSCTSTDQCDDGGTCRGTVVENGAPCDDGDSCTTGDQCQNGACVGTPLDCSAFSDQCNTGTCNPDTGSCRARAIQDGTDCNDENLCTTADQCVSGTCTGTTLDCSAFNSACTVGACDAGTGECGAVSVGNGTACDDLNNCTTNDQCTSGACSGTAVDCAGLDDPCNQGTCDPDTGGCVASPFSDGTNCDDGDLCTGAGFCASGVCDASPVNCSFLDDVCVVGTCNAGTGACEGLTASDGTGCDDGDLCTQSDQCTDGTCGGSAVDCSGLDDQCNTGTCNAGTGTCEATPVGNGTGCDDGDLCTQSDQCTDGTCGGSAVDCSGLDDQCNTGTCNAGTGTCEATPVGNGTGCDDGLVCTITDTCEGGACVGSGDPCGQGPTCASFCSEPNGSCLTPAGTPCEDDGNVCTDDVCDGAGNCGIANEDPCDDGLFCTENDRCLDTSCTGTNPCGASQGCTGTCSEEEQACRTCGHPFSNARCVVNAVFILQGAVGLRDCEACICDVNSNGSVTSTDALGVLNECVGNAIELTCTIDAMPTSTTLGVATTSTVPSPTTTFPTPL